MDIIYQDKDILVCVKPAGVLSTDEPGGVPDLVREALGDPNANVRTVHRLDQVVSGLMVLARSADAASELSRQIRDGEFEKEYLAVVHGTPEKAEDTLRDLLLRSKQERKTYVVTEPGDTDFQLGQTLSEDEYYEACEDYGDAFVADMGAQAIKKLLDEIDLDKLIEDLRKEADEAKGQKQKKIQKRLKTLEGMQAAGIKPEDLVLTVIPVIPLYLASLFKVMHFLVVALRLQT